MRASVSGRPDRSPTMSTSSPTTIGVRPNSRARIAVTRRLGVSAEHATPPAAVDGDHHGLGGVGVLGTGLGPRPRAPARAAPGRRTRRSRQASSACLGIHRLPGQHVGPQLRKVGQRLCRGGDVLDLDTGHPQPDDRAGRRHPVVGVGPPHAGVQGPRGDDQPVGGLLALPAEAVDFGAQCGQPVGFVAAQMRDSAAAATPSPGWPTRPARRPTGRARRRRAGRRRSRRSPPRPAPRDTNRLGAQPNPASPGSRGWRRPAAC